MRLPRHFVPRNDGAVKNQIPLTPFAKGGNDSWVSIFILIWYHESVMTVNPENLRS